MQTRLKNAIKKILAMLLISMFIMHDSIAIGESINNGLNSQNAEEQSLLEIAQTLITSQEYKIDGQNKKILQFALTLNAENLQEQNLQEGIIKLSTPIENSTPEEIYLEVQKAVNFENITWKYENNEIIITLKNSEIETAKEQKTDCLVVTYVYSEDVDTTIISTVAKAEGKTYSNQKIASEETKYNVQNVTKLGNIIQINNYLQEIFNTELAKENQSVIEKTEVNLTYKNIKLLDKIDIEDNLQEFYSKSTKINLNQTYKITLINKKELLNAIGENGKLIIKNAENSTVIAEVDKNAEETNGYIIIRYDENISKIKIEIELGESKTALGNAEYGNFSIYHTKEIEKNETQYNITKLVKTINITTKLGENEVNKLKMQIEGKVSAKTTYSEFGINKQELTSMQENDTVLTITMHTEDKKYDLNKNPEFKILLPQEIENAEIGDITLLNNKDFKINTQELQENENGQKEIIIKLEGEQTEYTTDVGNVQIIIPLKLITTKLIPTTNSKIELYYTNEKAESYKTEENGQETINISILSEEDIIVATQAQIEEQNILSYKTNNQVIEIQKTEEKQNVNIKGIVINNTKEIKENIYIIGKNELLSQITTSKGTVYYSETEEGTWTEEFKEGHIYYKIEIDSLEKGEKLEFSYNMLLPEKEEDTNYKIAYQLYETNNAEKTSTINVNVKAIQKQEENLTGENKEIEVNYSSFVQSGAEELNIGSRITNSFSLQNNTSEEKDVIIQLEIPECTNTENLVATISEETEEYFEVYGEKLQILEEIGKVTPTISNNVATYNIKIEPNKKIWVAYYIYVEKYVSEYIQNNVVILANNELKTYSKQYKAIPPVNIIANMKAYANEEEIKEGEKVEVQKGDTITYITEISNSSITKGNIRIASNIPNGFKVKKLEVLKNNNLIEQTEDIVTNEVISGEMELTKQDKVIVNLELELLQEIEDVREVENYIEIYYNQKVAESNKVIVNLVKKSEEPITPDTPSEPEIPKEQNYSISGLAWLDKNKNGKQDEAEDYIKGIQVVLLNTETNEEVATAITDIDGKYTFKNIENGKYLVKFGYNTSKYNLTVYKQIGVEETENSDAILATQNGETIAKTDIIEVENVSITNIDIGLVLKQTFDLEVKKYIKKVTVQNSEGKNTYEYENTNFAKIDIPSKYLKGTNLVIEYEIQITNNGDIAGYVTTLTDKKPEGLEFASELNNSWYEGSDGNIYCIELSQDEIKAGETKTVNLVLTKTIEDTKIQYITNEVELEEIFNEYLEEEKDILNNQAEATIIISIKTGAISKYWGLWVVCALIIGTGVYFINKKTIRQ